MDQATARQVAAAFDLGAVVDETSFVARGAMGEIWKLSTEAGRWAVKRLFPWAEYPPLPFDVEVQRRAGERGIPVPAPVVSSAGAVVSLDGHRFRVYEWADLTTELAPPVSPERAAEAGALLGRIHSLGISVADQSVDPWYVETHDEREWQRVIAAARRADVVWAASLEERLPLIARLVAVVRGVAGEAQLCHRDFGPDNVIPRAGDGRLVVLDWENAGPLPAEQELASALENWTTARGRVADTAARSFFSAYRDAGGPATVQDVRCFASGVFALLNYLHVVADQALHDGEHRGFGEAAVNEILGSRLENMAAGIDALLALNLA